MLKLTKTQMHKRRTQRESDVFKEELTPADQKSQLPIHL